MSHLSRPIIWDTRKRTHVLLLRAFSAIKIGKRPLVLFFFQIMYSTVTLVKVKANQNPKIKWVSDERALRTGVEGQSENLQVVR